MTVYKNIQYRKFI